MKKCIFDKYLLNLDAVCGLPEIQAAGVAGDL